MNNKEENNIFIDIIYSKVNRSFKHPIKYLKHRIKLNKFKRYINGVSPDFNLLLEMANFVKIAEVVFMYDNRKDTPNKLFSDQYYKGDRNGFSIRTDECYVSISLREQNRNVSVELVRTNGNHLKTVQTFKDSEWVTKQTMFNELLLEQTIRIIDKAILELFDWCYRKA